MRKSKKQMQIDMGKKIHTARMRMGISQKELARFLQVTDKTVSSYEVGRVTPPLIMLKRMSVILHEPLTALDKHAVIQIEEIKEKLKQVEEEVIELKKLLHNLQHP